MAKANIETFEQLLRHIVNAGFEVKLADFSDTEFAYEIQTGAKSNLTIANASNDYLCYFKDRYDDGFCYSYEQFLAELKGCLYGKEYACPVFFEFLVKEGMMTKQVETITKYI